MRHVCINIPEMQCRTLASSLPRGWRKYQWLLVAGFVLSLTRSAPMPKWRASWLMPARSGVRGLFQSMGWHPFTLLRAIPIQSPHHLVHRPDVTPAASAEYLPLSVVFIVNQRTTARKNTAHRQVSTVFIEGGWI
jgi:hypothetical protein